MSEEWDISESLIAKSDQMNNADLMGGPVIVQVISVVHKSDQDQPTRIRVSGGHMAYKPCKSMRRILGKAWGNDIRKWPGRWIELYRDPEVTFGKKETGGIRIRSLSHIEHDFDETLQIRRGVYQKFKIRKLTNPEPKGAPTANLEALLADNNLTTEQVDKWLLSIDKPTLMEADDQKRAEFAGWLGAKPSRIDTIRKHAEEAS